MNQLPNKCYRWRTWFWYWVLSKFRICTVFTIPVQLDFQQGWKWSPQLSNKVVTSTHGWWTLQNWLMAVKTLCSLCYVCLGLVTQSCLTLCDPLDCSHQAPLSMGFPRQKYWSGLPFPSPGILPDPGAETTSLALQTESLPLGHLGSLCWLHTHLQLLCLLIWFISVSLCSFFIHLRLLSLF